MDLNLFNAISKYNVKCIILHYALIDLIIFPLFFLQVEPYFTTLALFDARDGKKLTEDFHVDINHNAILGMIPDPEGPTESVVGDNVPSEWISKTKQV